MPVGVHALVEHTDHVNATITDDVEDDMASDGAAPVTGTNLVSGVPSTGIVCEALASGEASGQAEPFDFDAFIAAKAARTS